MSWYRKLLAFSLQTARDILGVIPGDSPDEIKTKYRELAKRYDPSASIAGDMSGGTKNTIDPSFQTDIAEAYALLVRRQTDPTKPEEIGGPKPPLAKWPHLNSRISAPVSSPPAASVAPRRSTNRDPRHVSNISFMRELINSISAAHAMTIGINSDIDAKRMIMPVARRDFVKSKFPAIVYRVKQVKKDLEESNLRTNQQLDNTMDYLGAALQYMSIVTSWLEDAYKWLGKISESPGRAKLRLIAQTLEDIEEELRKYAGI